jgi:hypothetical protein
LALTLIENDLLAALTELLETLLLMTSGQLQSAAGMERYHKALEWAETGYCTCGGRK